MRDRFRLGFEADVELHYQRETVEGIEREIFPLLQKHWKEIAPHEDIELYPDYEMFLSAEAMGILRLFTARQEDETLVGYALFFLKHHHHYRQSLQATLDLLFLDPSVRGTGLSFLRFVENDLIGEGAEVINFHVGARFDYSVLLQRLGYWPSETTFTKRVKR